MRAVFMVLMGLFGVLMTLDAQAQLVELNRVDPQALACLRKEGPAPTYPAEDERLRLPGLVRLSLRFTAPDQAPEVELLFRAASEAMLEEVKWFVRGYRLPCMAPGEAPVTAVQEFAFNPRVTDPITWTAPRPVQDSPPGEAARAARPSAVACTRTPKGQPDYAGGSLQREVSNVFVRLSFTAPDAPPEVKVVYATPGADQAKAVTDYVSQYRMPCLAPGAKPVRVQQHFQFRPYGVGARVFKDAVPLVAFLSNMKGIRSQRASFDFNTMACPFQVAWTLGKPGLENSVGQVGKPDLNRTEFLAWLAGQEMDLKDRQFEQMVGQTLIVNVGCGRFDLAPAG